jgi:hypothetical protein
MLAKPVEVLVLGFAPGWKGPAPEVWLTAARPPHTERRLVLED